MDAIAVSRASESIQRSETRVGHVEIIDAVRGVAALLVAFMHCREVNWIGMQAYWKINGFDLSPSSLVAYATMPFTYGAIGVPILFVVSGYVIHRRSAKQLATGELAFSPSQFLLRRLIRIYPTFLAAILLTLVCDHITRSVVEHKKLGDTSLWSLFANIAALQGVIAPPFGSNGPLWSLAIEIQFYAVYPLALVMRRQIGATPMLSVALGLMILGYITLAQNNITAFPQYYFSWWLGAYIADRQAEGKRLPVWWPILPSLLLPVGCYLASNKATFFAFVCWAVGFAPLLAWLVRSPLALGETLLHRVGRFSYSIYAAHLPIIVLFNALLLNGVHSNNIASSFVIAALTGIVCYLFFLASERPFIRLLERMPR